MLPLVLTPYWRSIRPDGSTWRVSLRHTVVGRGGNLNLNCPFQSVDIQFVPRNASCGNTSCIGGR